MPEGSDIRADPTCSSSPLSGLPSRTRSQAWLPTRGSRGTRVPWGRNLRERTQSTIVPLCIAFAQRRGDAAQVEAGEVCPGEVSTAQHEPQVGGEDTLDVAAVEPTIEASLSAGADPRVAA